ncbi:MAG: AMP-binding protein [Burkholderiales bacterium]|nr:AMP-binding protein [Burkholderiales bacterium]
MNPVDAGSASLLQLLEGNDAAPAFVAAGRTVSRAALAAAAADAAAHLAARGWRRGDVLALWLPNGAAWLQLLFAAARLGVLIVPISPRYKAPEARHLLEVSRARAVVAPRRFLDVEYAAIARTLRDEVPTLGEVIALDDVDAFLPAAPAPAVAPAGAGTDLLCCFSTSGTTGYPKLAAHGHASIARHARHVAAALDIRAGDAMLCALPLFGVFGFMTALATLAGGGACVFLPVFDPVEAAHAVARHRITHMIGSDSMFDPMLKVEGADFRTWRRAVQGEFVGLALAVTERGDALGIRFSNTYGSSECYSLMSFQDWNASAAVRARAGGVLVDPRIGVRVVDPEDGRDLGDGEPGELLFRGPNVLAEYLNNPEATARAMTADGWYRSGDLGYRDGPGYVYLARMGDSLRLRGFLVSPAEIEACLMAHPAVGGAQVVGVRRPGEGDVAVAYVIAGAAVPEEAALLAHCRERMASYKVPRRVIVIDAFPAINGPNGNKIQKRVLREWADKALA